MFAGESYQIFLKRVYADRLQKNAAYSLKAFSRDVKLPASRLSDIFNGKQGLSRTNAEKIVQSLGLSKRERDFFLLSVDAQHARNRIAREAARLAMSKTPEQEIQRSLSLDVFQVIAGWQHNAILELTEVEGFQSTISWIAQRLQISEVETELAIARLKKVGLIEERKGRLYSTAEEFSHSSLIPSEAIRSHHRSLLEKATRSIDEVPVDQRDLSSTTFSFDESRMSEAQKLIKEFRLRFARLMTQSDRKNRVYNLSIQLIPLDQRPAQNSAQISAKISKEKK